MFWIYAAMAAQTLISAGTFLVVKAATGLLAPLELAWFRFVVAALAYVTVLLATGRRLLPPRTAFRRLLLLALLGTVFNQCMFLSGQARTPPTHGAILYALTPACVLLFERMLLGAAITGRKALGTTIAFSGAALVLLQNGIDLAGGTFAGDGMILAAVFSWSAYTVLARAEIRAHGAVSFTAWALILGAVMSTPFAPLVVRAPAEWPAIPAGAWLGVLYLGLMTSTLAYLLWNVGLRHLEAAQVAVFSNLQPVCTGLLSWFVFGERLTWHLAGGFALVVLGVSRVQRRRPLPPPLR
ncbi:MAG TPA: DMT family transporter [Planctomycetota bacterium]